MRRSIISRKYPDSKLVRLGRVILKTAPQENMPHRETDEYFGFHYDFPHCVCVCTEEGFTVSETDPVYCSLRCSQAGAANLLTLTALRSKTILHLPLSCEVSQKDLVQRPCIIRVVFSEFVLLDLPET